MIEPIILNPWVWILGGVLILLVLFSIGGVIYNAMTGWDSIFGLLGGLSLIIAIIIAPFYFAMTLVPYDSSFYYTYRVTGEIVDLETAFSGDEGTMSQVFVAEIEGVDYLIKSDDQRFRTLEVGDDANLICQKRFEYFQEPYFACGIGGRG